MYVCPHEKSRWVLGLAYHDPSCKVSPPVVVTYWDHHWKNETYIFRMRSPLRSMPKLPGMNLASKPRTFEVTPTGRVVRLCTTGRGMLNLTPEPVSECVSEKTISETPSRRNTRIWRFGKKSQNNICLTKSRR